MRSFSQDLEDRIPILVLPRGLDEAAGLLDRLLIDLLGWRRGISEGVQVGRQALDPADLRRSHAIPVIGHLVADLIGFVGFTFPF
jgi:hypothetical protein